jgi:predicted nucleotidyltransferase component of viral defense system
MLYYETIDDATLRLLKKIQRSFSEESVRLVGGTALALQIGHRRSVDLDFFGEFNIPGSSLIEMANSWGDLRILHQSNNIYIFIIDGVKVDFVNYPYPWLKDCLVIDDIRMASPEDIAAMKLSAITGRGTKKDFVDLYYLLKKFELNEIIGFYTSKFHDGSAFLVLKSLSYFEDAEKDPDPVVLQDFDWGIVKEEIKRKLRAYVLDQKA